MKEVSKREFMRNPYKYVKVGKICLTNRGMPQFTLEIKEIEESLYNYKENRDVYKEEGM